MIDTAAIRKLFPHTKKTAYFNAASTGPLSEPAYRLQDANFRKTQMAAVGNQEEIFRSLDHIRELAGRIFGCRASEAGFGFNTTFGLNLAAYGLPLKKGDEVLIPDIEFPANVYPWLGLHEKGIRVKFIKSTDGFFDVENFRKAIGKKTRVVALSLVQYFNGYKVDLAEVGRICKTHNLFLVVDVMQGAGVEPLQLSKWGVDIASAGGQKWLLASQGSGIFYISEETKSRIIAPWRSWLGVDWKCNWSNLQDFTRPFDPSARQFEMGTYPSALVLSLEWSLNFLLELKIRNVQRHTHSQLNRLISYLKRESFFRITSSLEPEHRSAILTFTTDRGDIRAIHRSLLKQGVITALREGSIRVSVHVYNDDFDMDRLIAGLRQESRSQPTDKKFR